MDPNKISRFIYELRKEKGLSQYQLADMIPITRQAVSKWERGKTIPDTQTLVILSDIFGVSINELLKGERLQTNTIEDLEETTLSIIDESNKKTKKIKKITITLTTIILILLLSFLSYYFISSYNSTKVYTIYGNGKNFNTADGIMIITKEKIYVKLGELINKNNNEIASLKLYYKDGKQDKAIIQNDNVDSLVIRESIGYSERLQKIYLNHELYLEITYNNTEKEIIKLHLVKDFANNKFFFQKQKTAVNKQENKTKKEEEIKKEEKPVIEEVKEEPKIENKPTQEEPKQEPPVVETPKEKTTEEIINKIKEVCMPDLDSYVCEFPGILVFYMALDNQITIYKNDDMLGYYEINSNNYVCLNGNCEEEFKKIINDNLFS